MLEDWPVYNKKYSFRKEEANCEGLKELVVAIRNTRNEVNVAPSKRLSAYIIASDEKFMASAVPYLNKLAGIGEVKFIADKAEINERVTAIVTHDAEILIPLGELIDEKKEIERIQAEIAETEAIIKKTEGLLNNAAFVAKAPQKLVDGEREKLLKAQDKLAKLKDKLSMFA